MLEQSISDLLKKRNLGWNLNSEGPGLELVDLRLPASRGARFGSFALFVGTSVRMWRLLLNGTQAGIIFLRIPGFHYHPNLIPSSGLGS